MNLNNIATIGKILRWLGILIALLFLINHFTSLTIPLVEKIKFSAIVIWLIGTIMLRWTQFQQNKSNQE